MKPLESDVPLTEFQIEVARLFLELQESRGFVLAGGAALVALGLTNRPTQDLDLFTSPGSGGVDAAEQALIGAAEARGWRVSRVRVADGFRRLMILGEGKVLVDLAVDASPTSAPILTQVGPTLPARDLVGRKVIALFDRAAARDFVDVDRLAEHFGRQELLT